MDVAAAKHPNPEFQLFCNEKFSVGQGPIKIMSMPSKDAHIETNKEQMLSCVAMFNKDSLIQNNEFTMDLTITAFERVCAIVLSFQVWW